MEEGAVSSYCCLYQLIGMFQMKATFTIIDKITNTSGIEYTLGGGANAGLHNTSVWEGIVKVCQYCLYALCYNEHFIFRLQKVLPGSEARVGFTMNR